MFKGKLKEKFKIIKARRTSLRAKLYTYCIISSLIVSSALALYLTHYTMQSIQHLGNQTDKITLAYYQFGITIGLVYLFTVFSSFLLARYLEKRLLNPLRQITKHTQDITGQKDSDDTAHNDDMSVLTEQINLMAHQLNDTETEIEQQILEATSDLKSSMDTMETRNIELGLAYKKSEAVHNKKVEFISRMNDEIHEPLNSITGFTQLLLDSNLSPHQRNYIENINGSVKQLFHITENVKEFSDISEGKCSLDRIPMDIRDSVEEVLSLLAPVAEEASLELVSFCYADVPLRIIGDPLRLKQIMTNFVSNAIKFTQEGSVVVRIMLEEMHNNEATIRIAISDTGVGLTPEQQQELFQAFAQIETHHPSVRHGVGLGLATAKKLVQQMKGKIGLDSEINKGSTFWFTIAAEALASTEKHYEYNQLIDTNILLYEPHPTTQLALSHLFTFWKMRVNEVNEMDVLNRTLVENGDAYDVLVLGHNSGLQAPDNFVNLIAAARQYYNGVIIVLSNITDKATLELFKSHGATIALTKPVRQKVLYRHLCEMHGKSNKASRDILANTQPARKQARILAVDDEPTNLKLLSVLAEHLNVLFIPASTGQQAIDITSRIDFDLIILDMQMPELNGLQVANHLRTHSGKNQRTPIAMLSANILASDRETLLSAGINDCLLKPLNSEQLRGLIQKWTDFSLPQETGKLTVMPVRPTSKPNKPTLKAKSYEQSQIKAQPTLNDNQRDTMKNNFANNNQEKVIDKELGLKLASHNEPVANEMLLALIERLPEDHRTIVQAFEQCNREQLEAQIHKLHGALCYCGAPRLKNATASLHQEIKNIGDVYTKDQIQQLNPWMQEFNNEVDLLLRVATQETHQG